MRLILALIVSIPALAQEPGGGDRVRALWSTEFRKARTESASMPAPAPAAAKTTAPAAKSAPPTSSLIGVTIWHLRPSKPADPQAVRAIVHEKGNRPHTPVRVSSQSRFFEGDQLRLTVESGRAGYLYVISRERYNDGTSGAYQLIFPTTRLHGGDNRVRAGYPVEIPSSNDDPSYFTMRRSRPDHSGEEVLFIVAPGPIAGVTIGEEPMELSEGLVKSWQANWVTKVQSIDAPTAEELPLTSEEVKLLRAGSAFQETDPLPQTLYRVDTQPDRPFLVAVQLRMKQ